MAEKILNTRIALKIDTLENWNSSTLPLRKGELALATVAATAGTGLTEPVIMIKVGEDGKKTFKDLEWNVYAKASDVISAAKSEAGLTAFINNVINNSKLATDEELSALAGRVTTAEGEIDALQGLVGDSSVATQINEKIAALKLAETYDAKGAAADALADAKEYADGLDSAMNTRVEALEAVDHEHANKAELDKIANGDKAKWDAMEQNAKDYADGLNTAMDSRVDVLEAKFGSGEGTVEAQIAAAVAVETAAREAADTALGNRVKTIEDDYLKAADKTELAGDIKDNADAIDALETLVGDTAVATQISTAVAAEAEIARAAEKANADAIAILNGDGDGSVSKQVADAVAGIVNGAPAAYDTLKEISDWIEKHPESVSALNSAIKANSDAIDALEALVGTLPEGEADVVAYIQKAVAAEKTRAEGIEAGLNSRLQTVEAAIGESGSVAEDIEAALTAAKGYADTEIKKLADGAVATNTADIAALDTKVGDKPVATQINEAIAALAIGDYAKAADLTAEINRAKAAEQANATAAANAQAAAEAAQAAADKAQGEVDALEIEVAKKANAADLHAIATSGNVNDLVQTAGDVLIFDCGSSAV